MAKPFESRLQDLVYNVEVGVGLILIKIFLYVLFALACGFIYVGTQFNSFTHAEAMEQAQLARSFAETNQLTTKVVRPSSMRHLIENVMREGTREHRNPRIDDHPDIRHAPGFPVVIGTVFKVLKPDFAGPRSSGVKHAPEQIVVSVNAFFGLLAGLMLYLTARRLFDPKVAIITSTAFFLSNALWSGAITGLPTTLAMFLMMAMFYSLLVASTNRREGHSPVRWLIPFLFAVLSGAALMYTTYSAVAVVLPAFLFAGLSMGRRSWLVASLWLVLVLGLFAPWIARNLKVAGTPFGMAPDIALTDTTLFPKNSYDRSLVYDVPKADKISTHVRRSFVTSFPDNFRQATQGAGDGILSALFVATLFYAFSRREVNHLRWAVLFGIVLLVAAASLFGAYTKTFLLLMLPFATMYGVAFFNLLLDRLNIRVQILNAALTGLVLAINAVPLIFTMVAKSPPSAYPPYNPAWITSINGILRDKEMVCTDIPWATAWYGNRNSLLLPATMDQFYEIYDTTKRISGLYITTVTRDGRFVSDLLTGADRSWFQLNLGQIPGDFPLKEAFPLGNADQVFFTDRRPGGN
jgi:hypothetical protein